MNSEMGLISELMGDDNTVFNDEINANEKNEYYQGKAEHILKQIDSSEHYFHFLNIIVKNFNESLNEKQKQIIKETMGIRHEIIYKDKIIIKKSNEKKKTKLNEFNYDDY